jgi:hypothetical protein
VIDVGDQHGVIITRGRFGAKKQEARSKKQEARSKKQEARSKKQEARSKKQGQPVRPPHARCEGAQSFEQPRELQRLKPSDRGGLISRG